MGRREAYLYLLSALWALGSLELWDAKPHLSTSSFSIVLQTSLKGASILRHVHKINIQATYMVLLSGSLVQPKF
jgi:hypothetical protein